MGGGLGIQRMTMFTFQVPLSAVAGGPVGQVKGNSGAMLHHAGRVTGS